MHYIFQKRGKNIFNTSSEIFKQESIVHIITIICHVQFRIFFMEYFQIA